MSEIQLSRIRLYFEDRGSGVPILCIHGAGSRAVAWSMFVDELARLGRVITYDRRGCHRSERPVSYLTTTVEEQADDAAALLEALNAIPAVVIGRSLGGEIALDLAVRHPQHVRALVLLDPAVLTLDPEVEQWGRMLQRRFHEVLDREGIDAAAETFFRLVMGDAGWESVPPELRSIWVANGPALLAELDGQWPRPDAKSLARVDQPCLIVASEASPPAFRRTVERLAPMLPNAHVNYVPGGHLISPLEPAVLSLLRESVTPATRSV